MIIRNIATGCSYKMYKYGGVCIPVKDNVLHQVVLHNVCKEKNVWGMWYNNTNKYYKSLYIMSV